jgi:hypothetical protein
VVVGEDRAGRVLLNAVLDQVFRRARDRVGWVVDVSDAAAVGVGRHAADDFARRVDRQAAPFVARSTADADLHRPGRAKGVRAAVHAGQVGPAVVALHLADPGEDHPGDSVLASRLPEQGEIVGRDRVAGVRTGRGLGALHGRASGAGLEQQRAAAHDQHRGDDEPHRRDEGDGDEGTRRCAATVVREPAGSHELPAEASSMSLACQLLPELTTVTAYWSEFWL